MDILLILYFLGEVFKLTGVVIIALNYLPKDERQLVENNINLHHSLLRNQKEHEVGTLYEINVGECIVLKRNIWLNKIAIFYVFIGVICSLIGVAPGDEYKLAWVILVIILALAIFGITRGIVTYCIKRRFSETANEFIVVEYDVPDYKRRMEGVLKKKISEQQRYIEIREIWNEIPKGAIEKKIIINTYKESIAEIKPMNGYMIGLYTIGIGFVSALATLAGTMAKEVDGNEIAPMVLMGATIIIVFLLIMHMLYYCYCDIRERNARQILNILENSDGTIYRESK